jgi:hypothetical protein
MDNFVYEIDNVLPLGLYANIIDKFELDDCNKISGLSLYLKNTL